MPTRRIPFLRTLLAIFATAAILNSATPKSASDQQEVFVPANDVSFTIRPERKSYRLGEPVKFTYTVKNISGGPVFVPRVAWDLKCPSSPKVWAWFENSTGKHFIPGYAGSCSPNQMKVSDRMRKEAVLLRPSQEYQDYYLLETRTFKDALKPGKYRVERPFTDGASTSSTKLRNRN